MTITDEQIKAVAVRICELRVRNPFEIVGGGEFWKMWVAEARTALITAQAIRDVMGSDADGAAQIEHKE